MQRRHRGSHNYSKPAGRNLSFSGKTKQVIKDSIANELLLHHVMIIYIDITIFIFP